MQLTGALFALTSLAGLVASAPVEEFQKRATSYSGFLYATRLHGSPAYNQTLEYKNDGNLGASGLNNGFGYYPSNNDPSRGVLVITGAYCLGAVNATGNSYLQEQYCTYNEEQLWTPNDQGDYVVFSLRGNGSSAHPSRPYLLVNGVGDVLVTKNSAGSDNIHLVMYK